MSVNSMGFCCCFYLCYQCLKDIIYDYFFFFFVIQKLIAHSSNSKSGSSLQGVEGYWIWVVLFVFYSCLLSCFLFRDWNRNMHFLKSVKAIIICCLPVFFINSGNKMKLKECLFNGVLLKNSYVLKYV